MNSLLTNSARRRASYGADVPASESARCARHFRDKRSIKPTLRFLVESMTTVRASEVPSTADPALLEASTCVGPTERVSLDGCVSMGALSNVAQRGSGPLRVGIDLFRRVDRKARRNIFHRQGSPEPETPTCRHGHMVVVVVVDVGFLVELFAVVRGHELGGPRPSLLLFPYFTRSATLKTPRGGNREMTCSLGRHMRYVKLDTIVASSLVYHGSGGTF
jgi:hypothetical protein